MNKPIPTPLLEPAPQQTPSKGRISPRLRRAVEAIVWEGADRAKAAEIAGMHPNSLRLAFKRPHVKALMRKEFAELREGAPFKAYANIVQLGDAANSEDVRLRANQWVAGVDGLSPVTKVSGQISVRHGFEGYAYQPPGMADTSSAIVDAQPIDNNDDD